MIYNPISINEFEIYDIFHNTSDNIVIISPWSPKQLSIKYKNKKFDMYICPHTHTVIYVLKYKITYTDVIELNIDDKTIKTPINKYPDFKDEILMSTIVYNEDNYINQWITFHHNLGVNRFIIYDNSGYHDRLSHKSSEKKSNLENVLNDFIKNGLVILIKWSYPYRRKFSGFSGQTTQQNHSIWAFRNSKYIGLFDVDEYINIQTDNANIDSFFNNLIKIKNINTSEIGGFRLLNKFFYNPNNLPENDYNFLKIYNCDKIKKIGNEKGFVIPKYVNIYSIHVLLLGKRMYTVPFSMLFFNHYYFLNKSNRGKEKTELIDMSIKKHTKFLDN